MEAVRAAPAVRPERPRLEERVCEPQCRPLRVAVPVGELANAGRLLDDDVVPEVDPGLLGEVPTEKLPVGLAGRRVVVEPGAIGTRTTTAWWPSGATVSSVFEATDR